MIYIYMTVLATILIAMSDFVASTTTDFALGASYRNVISKSLYGLAFFVIFIPGAIRSYVGIDYTTYSKYQIPAVLEGREVKVESLYRWVIRIGYLIGGKSTYQYIFAITNFLIVFFLFLYIKRLSLNKVLSIIVFMSTGFFFFSLSGMRQSIGVAIALWSLKYIEEKKFIPYVITILLASLFHTAVIIFLVFYFLSDIKINPFVVALVMLAVNRLAPYLRNIIISISDRVGLYSEYFGGTFDTGGYNKIFVVLILLVMLFVCLSRLVLGKEVFYKNNTALNIHYVACMVVAMISYLPTPSRLLFLFIPVYITLIPNLVVQYKNKNIRVILYLIVVSVCIFFMYELLFVQNSYGVLPYNHVS